MTRSAYQRLSAVFLALIWLMPNTASAQSIYGQSGLFVHPTALTPAKGSITLGASYFTQRNAGQSQTEWTPVSISYGAADRTEIGALFVERLAAIGTRRGSFGGFVHQQIVPESVGRPAVALSGSYLGTDVNIASAALVSSYHFRRDKRTVAIGHAGILWGWRGGDGPDSDSVSGFMGAEVPLSGGLTILGEYGSRFAFDHKDRSSIGVMWHGRRGFSVAVGMVNVGRSSDNRFFVGVGVPLGGNK